jgi:hypothetical protein
MVSATGRQDDPRGIVDQLLLERREHVDYGVADSQFNVCPTSGMLTSRAPGVEPAGVAP